MALCDEYKNKTDQIVTYMQYRTKEDFTDKNIFDNSYQLVKHFPDFPLWENRIAYFKYFTLGK